MGILRRLGEVMYLLQSTELSPRPRQKHLQKQAVERGRGLGRGLLWLDTCVIFSLSPTLSRAYHPTSTRVSTAGRGGVHASYKRCG